MPGFAEDMAEYDEQFDQAEAASGPPLFTDGTHQAIITISRVEENDYGWQWVLGFGGLDVNTKRRAAIRKWTNLPPDNEERYGYVKADLEKLGFEGKLSGLEQACIDEQFIGLVCDIGVKTKTGAERDYTNVYLNRVHDKQAVDAWLASRVPAGDDGVAGDDLDAPPVDTDEDIPL